MKGLATSIAIPLFVFGCNGELGSAPGGAPASNADDPSEAASTSEEDEHLPGEVAPPITEDVDTVDVEEVRTIEPTQVLTMTEECFTLNGNAQGLSVSPEGQIWVVLESGGEQASVQVIDPAVGSPQPPLSLELPAIVHANAWTASEASLSTSEELWRVDGPDRVNVLSPLQGAEISSFCGDLSLRGAIVSNGDLYEMRGDSWWQYSAPDDAPDVPTEIVRFDGSCTDRDEAHWIAGDAGTIWRVGRDSVSAPIQIEGTVKVAGTAGFLGVMTDSQVWLGSVAKGTQTWEPWDLADGASPSQLDLAGGVTWLVADSRLYHFDGETWSKSESEIKDGSHFAAYSTGVWTAEGDQACHYAMGDPIQLEGVRPFDQTRDQLVPIVIHTVATPLVELNGVALEVTSDDAGHQATLRLDDVGWSKVSVTADALVRNLWVKRIPTEQRSWEDDILPIYETSCAGAACHNSSGDADSPPDLGTFESWLSLSHAIRNRVVESETMPPTANRGPEWSDAQKEIISEWLEGGLLP